MTTQLQFFVSRHPVHRLSVEMKAEFVRAQHSALPVAFPNALSFCERVLGDLKLSIFPPAEWRDMPAAEVADLDLADLVTLFDRMLRAASIPDSARQMHADNLSRRAQLIRAFDNPDAVLEWVTTKVV